MADGNISKIQLPNGETYNIKDATVGIDSTYDEVEHNVILTVGSLPDADDREY